MRDYLYIWHEPQQQFVVASGIEFRDFVPTLRDNGGVLIIEGRSEVADNDTNSGFDFVAPSRLPQLAKENIYSWGNFAWADYAASVVPSIGDDGIAEILFFGHRGRPLNTPEIPKLQNRFLVYAHDDGWYLKLYYTNWNDVGNFLSTLIQPTVGVLDIALLKDGGNAYWLKNGTVYAEDKTHDVDSILNRRL